MANDHVYLRCAYCGGDIRLATYYPGSGLGDVPGDLDLLALLNEHLRECHPHNGEVDLHGDPGFFLEAESADDWPRPVGKERTE